MEKPITKVSLSDAISIFNDALSIGQFASCTFIKKDGTARPMNCKGGVIYTGNTTGEKMAYDPKSLGYKNTLDVQASLKAKKQQYRMVDLRTIQSVRAFGQIFIVR